MKARDTKAFVEGIQDVGLFTDKSVGTSEGTVCW